MLPGSGCTKDYEYLLIIIDIIFEAEKMFIPLYPFYLCVQRQQLLQNNQWEETFREVGAML